MLGRHLSCEDYPSWADEAEPLAARCEVLIQRLAA
jgi:hypothetical protein